MKKSIIRIVSAGAAVSSLLAMSVSAQMIVLTGEVCPLPVSGSLESEPVIYDVSELNVIGITEDKAVVILKETSESVEEETEEQETETMENTEEAGNSRVFYVSSDDFAELIPDFDLEMLPNAENYTELAVGSEGESVSDLQKSLIDLEILTGNADGQFGYGTESAVIEFQTRCGIDATGKADAVTQWAASELAAEAMGTAAEAEEYNYPPVYTVEGKYSDIYDQTTTDLTSYLTPDWTFSYDVFSGTGSIKNKNMTTGIGSLVYEERAIDRLQLDAELLLDVARDETNQVNVTPAVHVFTKGAYCPYIQSIQIKSGNSVEKIELFRTERSLSGVDVTEEDILLLTEGALELLDCEEDITFRFNGTGNSYDITVEGGQISEFVKAVK